MPKFNRTDEDWVEVSISADYTAQKQLMYLQEFCQEMHRIIQIVYL